MFGKKEVIAIIRRMLLIFHLVNHKKASPTSSWTTTSAFSLREIVRGTAFTFQHNFLPVPDSIEWNFGDTLSGANNISNDLNPTHVFSDGGEYEVSVDVWYPSGRFEHTSRVVEVTYAPCPTWALIWKSATAKKLHCLPTEAAPATIAGTPAATILP